MVVALFSYCILLCVGWIRLLFPRSLHFLRARLAFMDAGSITVLHGWCCFVLYSSLYPGFEASDDLLLRLDMVSNGILLLFLILESKYVSVISE